MLELLGVLSVPKEFKLLVENEIPNQKFEGLSDFKTKYLQPVRFQINFFTTRQILKQIFHNVSFFKSEVLKRFRYRFKRIIQKSDFEQKYAFEKLRFD